MLIVFAFSREDICFGCILKGSGLSLSDIFLHFFEHWEGVEQWRRGNSAGVEMGDVGLGELELDVVGGGEGIGRESLGRGACGDDTAVFHHHDIVGPEGGGIDIVENGHRSDIALAGYAL